MIKAILENIELDKKDEKLLKKALSNINLKKVRKSRNEMQQRLDIQKKMGFSETTLMLLNKL